MKSQQNESHRRWKEQIERKQASVKEADADRAMEPVELDENISSPNKKTVKKTGL